MPKPSDFMVRVQATIKAEKRKAEWIAVRQSMDMACIALNEAFGFGEDRLRKFADAYSVTWRDYAHLVVDDAQDDKDAEYSIEKIEQKLKEICGKYYVPREKRYD